MIYESKVVSFNNYGKNPVLKRYIYDFDNNILEVKIYHYKIKDGDNFDHDNYLIKGIHGENTNKYRLNEYYNISYGLLRLSFIYAPFFKDNYEIIKYSCNYTVDDVINYLSNIGEDNLKNIYITLFTQRGDGDIYDEYDIDSVIDKLKDIDENLFKRMVMEYKLKRQ